MKEVLKIEQVEDKTTTTGKTYARCKTSNGWMTCWNGKTIEALKNALNKPLNVEVEINEKGYKSIKGFTFAEEAVSSNKAKHDDHTRDTMPPSMLIAYSKDIFNVLIMGYEESDPVKKAEMLEYYADFSAMLLMRIKRKIEHELKLETIEEEEIEA